MDATILEAIPGANPSGANLRYEAIYAEIRARVRRARGEVVPDPDDPNFHGTDVEWRFVIGACRDLLRRRSKDLMLAAWLTEPALPRVAGWPGLCRLERPEPNLERHRAGLASCAQALVVPACR